MKIVVFGGSGYIGSHVTKKLLDTGNEIVVYDINKSERLSSEVQFIKGDILDKKAVEEAVKGSDVVYSFAGFADLDSASTNPIDSAQVNILGTLNILNACKNQNVKQFIYASTIYVYSESGGFYRCSKQSAELYIEEYQRKFGLNFTILRYGTVYGPGGDERNSVYRLLKSALEKKEIELRGDGEERREYIHVVDAAKIAVRVMEKKFYNKRFILTGHQSIPVKRLVDMVQEILQTELKVKYVEDSSPDHYKLTPYSFVPKAGEKFAAEIFTDMGQGLIECIAEIKNE